jgi:signal recognition particle GTPase
LTPPGQTLTYEKPIPVDATHRGMCQFSSSKDKTYKTFLRSIKRILANKNAIEVKNEHFVIPHRVSEHFTGRNDIRQQMIKSLISDRDFQCEAQQRFVLYGLGGSGKTQICLKFAQDHREM